LPVIEANSIQMRQLFQNMISNSLKFIKADAIPEITITSEIINGKEIEQLDESRLNEKILKIHIRDNGIGFNPDYSSKIFTTFKRLNNNSLYKGTGIGLAICKKVIENHNGFITAESNLTEGALFTITLPVSHSKSIHPIHLT
jgi:signal transduction histidine kinase